MIFKLLTRSGEIANLFSYGGQGGGKNFKPRVIQAGFLMKGLSQNKKKGIEQKDLIIVSDLQVKWEPTQIRHNVDAFYLQSFFIEIILKVAPSFHPDHSSSEENETLFNLLSNALFYSDQALTRGEFQKKSQVFFFTVKLIYYLGFSPDTESCTLCGEVLLDDTYLLIKEGGFCCHLCHSREHNSHEGTRFYLRQALTTKYQDYEKIKAIPDEVLSEVMNFFFYHSQINPTDIRSRNLLF